jgi:chemotaxis protein methyltransferase CheR
MEKISLPSTLPFSEKNFDQLAKIANEHAGIFLDRTKKNLVYNRLIKRIVALNLPDFDAYCALIKRGDSHELDVFINAITTNVTYFYREKAHFEYLAKAIFPELIKTKKEPKIRIWSAGCASGEEAYSIGMVVAEVSAEMSLSRGWDIKILATDIDSDSLLVAKKGNYEESEISHLTPEQKNKWFSKIPHLPGWVTIDPKIKNLVTFKHLNLIAHWPMRGKFDVIFCCNVAIYLNKEAQKQLFDRFRELLPLGGFLIIGLAETLYQSSDCFELIKNTIYQRVR